MLVWDPRASRVELITSSTQVRRDLADRGFAWVPRSAWSLGSRWEPHWQRLCEDWDHLELDHYLELEHIMRLAKARARRNLAHEQHR